jgi:putative SOS response-associated peptidase YedK
MCGRFRLSRRKELLAERFDVEPDNDWEPRYNIAPSQNVPVIRQHPEQTKRWASCMQWGLIPFWAKDPKYSQYWVMGQFRLADNSGVERFDDAMGVYRYRSAFCRGKAHSDFPGHDPD